MADRKKALEAARRLDDGNGIATGSFRQLPREDSRGLAIRAAHLQDTQTLIRHLPDLFVDVDNLYKGVEVLLDLVVQQQEQIDLLVSVLRSRDAGTFASDLQTNLHEALRGFSESCNVEGARIEASFKAVSKRDDLNYSEHDAQRSGEFELGLRSVVDVLKSARITTEGRGRKVSEDRVRHKSFSRRILDQEFSGSLKVEFDKIKRRRGTSES